MPDAALGSAGRLDAVSYPTGPADVRAAVVSAPAGDVVLLPFTSYRAPEWNGGRKVLDPLPRFPGRGQLPTPSCTSTDAPSRGRTRVRPMWGRRSISPAPTNVPPRSPPRGCRWWWPSRSPAGTRPRSRVT
ncbi:hypothetical protein [Nocardioides sp. B-3]|uniref:hypothetical protein n=1 Tax=Nocardioides sp. B-3 TaxID=2895565 RepID=UPI00215382A2|nr:hypothetical protein [Nocardioides sp. B-3]UUZ58844.1 hypothetical protein LP418_22665 [Nocardioides sp. B-3]